MDYAIAVKTHLKVAVFPSVMAESYQILYTFVS